MKIEIKKLESLEAIKKVLFMTYPIYAQAVLQEKSDYSIFVAFKDNQPIGLALYITRGENIVELLSVFVTQAYRNNHIATDLIKASLLYLQKENFNKITTKYMSKKSYTESFEKILNSIGFEDGVARQSIMKLSIESLQEANFLKKLIGLPEGFSFKLWKTVTAERINALKKSDEIDKWIPKGLEPFIYLKDYTQEYSTALFYKDEIIGWMIMHMIAKDTIRFTCSYAKDKFQYLVFQLRIFNTIKDELLNNGIKYISWTTPLHYKPMVNFNQKWMSKHCLHEGLSMERSFLIQ